MEDKFELERIKLQALLDWEIEQDVIDRFKLLSFGLRRKAALMRRIHFVKAATLLKRRFRKVLNLYREWKAEKKFREFADLIENFDKGTDKVSDASTR